MCILNPRRDGLSLCRCLDVGAGGVLASQASEGECGTERDACHGDRVLHQVAAALHVAGGVQALDGLAGVVQRLQLLVHLKAAHEHQHAGAADNEDELTLTPAGRYLTVVLYRQYLAGLNNLREQARAKLPGDERDLLFGDGTEK